jgi:shikimate dehydrogenase
MGQQREISPRRAAVIGWPVSHSLSPLIHSTWAAREGISARYEAIAVEPDDISFRRRIDQLKAEGLAGVNVTLPHKERALAIADSASEAAQVIGAANMLTFGDEGVLAENSDAMAVSKILLDLPERPATALVVGAGGAARGVLWALAKAIDPPHVLLTNRTRARAEDIAPIARAEVVDWKTRNAALEGADLIINATSLGMSGQPPLDLAHDRLKQGAAVFDIVYSPLETLLLKAARARGARTVDGLEMLMWQAVPGYLAWLGTRADVDDDLRRRLEATLKARGS